MITDIVIHLFVEDCVFQEAHMYGICRAGSVEATNRDETGRSKRDVLYDHGFGAVTIRTTSR
jgi:hypothetical protein